MCGIVGGWNIALANLERGLELIQHRGPDAHGIWSDSESSVVLGHRRLSILDLEQRSNQPMVCPLTGNVIVFNGEIYNFRAIRDGLRRLGWKFHTTSDTEVLLAAYGQWGVKCLRELNGMYAFTIFDRRRRELFLARDRVGKKPLYYAFFNDQFAFASEIKALRAMLPDQPGVVDREAVAQFYALGYIPGSASIYTGIRRLPPASFAQIPLRAASTSPSRYWSLPTQPRQYASLEEAATELDRLLTDAVKIRLESDVPVGLFLSSGIDSSMVAAIAHRLNPNIVAYTVKFGASDFDESILAAKCAGTMGLKHVIIDGDADNRETLDYLGRMMDEPFADSSILPTYNLCHAVSQHVKVALSGDGGDELFAGYDAYARTYKERAIEAFPSRLRLWAAHSHRLLAWPAPGRSFLRRLGANGAERFAQLGIVPKEAWGLPFVDEYRDRLLGSTEDPFRKHLLREINAGAGGLPSLLQAMTRLDFGSYLPDDVLVKVDRASMLSSLEVRSPLLDYRIAEFAFSIPDEFRMTQSARKLILKYVARKYVPPRFVRQPKRGFNIPESEWFRGQLSGITTERASGSRVLDLKRVEMIQEEHARTGRRNRELFRILVLANFERNHPQLRW